MSSRRICLLKLIFCFFLVCLKVKLLENNGVQILGPLVPLLRASYVLGHFGTLKLKKILILAKVLPLIFDKNWLWYGFLMMLNPNTRIKWPEVLLTKFWLPDSHPSFRPSVRPKRKSTYIYNFSPILSKFLQHLYTTEKLCFMQLHKMWQK